MRFKVTPKIAFITVESKKVLSAFEANLRLINILEPLATEITWVATNQLGDENELPEKVTLIKLDIEGLDVRSFFKRLFYHLWHQVKIVLELRKLGKVDVFIFGCGAYIPLLPVLFTTVFLRKRTILRIESRGSVVVREKSVKRNHRIAKIIIYSLMERIGYFLAHKILIEYENMIERYNLQKYQHKINLGNPYIDIALFKKTKELAERPYEVGYFGRLSLEKGALEFAQSLPLVLKGKESKILIVGEGEQKEEIRGVLTTNSIQSKVGLKGWVGNGRMPGYLNDTKIVVVPSYTEGLPKIVLEAMACGTVVLATPVGGMPEVIKDGETGFIMEDNSPECMARNVIRALNHPDLEEISKKARTLIERKYSYEATVERYRQILI